ncbi:hypothetical protein HXX02_07980 [Microbulbifer elongatus]|uniref:Uncharacterized protein n=1 Tax=Microbulbifer elongatus TaxID=86173 RepID=A0ABT1P1I8_9GAMM|nr:hypothetical protein [Microbulbifer elongatus]MCQ3829382.1 hypothetical protein [Microbulbifer elongatus]
MLKKIVITLLGILSTSTSTANIANVPTDYIHDGRPLPPVYFASTEYNDELYGILKGEAAFENVDNNVGTLPIGIIALVSKKRNADASSFATMMLSASTLGLTPIVGGDQVAVRYLVTVQGEVIAEYEYKLEGLDATNLYASQHTKLDEEDRQFITASIQNLLIDLNKEPSVQDIFNEYYLYFDEEL